MCVCVGWDVYTVSIYVRVRASTWLLVRHNVLSFGGRRVYRDAEWQKFARRSDNRRVDGNSTCVERERLNFSARSHRRCMTISNRK